MNYASQSTIDNYAEANGLDRARVKRADRLMVRLSRRTSAAAALHRHDDVLAIPNIGLQREPGTDELRLIKDRLPHTAQLLFDKIVDPDLRGLLIIAMLADIARGL